MQAKSRDVQGFFLHFGRILKNKLKKLTA